MNSRDERLDDPLIPGLGGPEFLYGFIGAILIFIGGLLLSRSFGYFSEALRLDAGSPTAVAASDKPPEGATATVGGVGTSNDSAPTPIDPVERRSRRRYRENSGWSWSWKDHFYELWILPIFIGVSGILGSFGVGMFGEGKGSLEGDFMNLVWAVPTAALGLWLTWRYDERKGGEPWPRIARFAVLHIAIAAALAIVIPLLFE